MMVDSINGGAGIAVTTVEASKAESATRVTRDRQENSSREIKSLKEPKLRITEVADQVAADKRSSLHSLDEIANDLREAITALNSALAKTPTKAIITRDEELNRFIVRIADEKSGEVVREIPSEAVLKFARNLQELKGLIFDKSL